MCYFPLVSLPFAHTIPVTNIYINININSCMSAGASSLDAGVMTTRVPHIPPKCYLNVFCCYYFIAGFSDEVFCDKALSDGPRSNISLSGNLLRANI